MLIKAYAKLNLYLDITGVLPNNYHSLETIMQTIDLADNIRLSVEPFQRGKTTIICDSPDVPTDSRNTVHKVIDAFFNLQGVKNNFDITVCISKKIPTQAGLGGGSADGAAVLKAINDIFGNPLTPEQLCKIAKPIGADIPFCLTQGTCLCTGVGENVKRIDPLADYVFLIVKPDFSFKTSEGYKLYDDNPISPKNHSDKLIKAIKDNDIQNIGNHMYNAFESVYRNAEIDEIKNKLVKNGAVSALMTGSGSAVFGIFTDIGTAKQAAENFKDEKVFISRPISPLIG